LTTEVMVFAALAYASRGWSVFPVPPGQKKSYKSAARSGGQKWGKTKVAEEIRRDWQTWPDANIGLPTGADSGFWVVEADTHSAHGVDGIASLAALVAANGELPPTRVAVSPSGSTHYYFKWVAGVEVKNSASRLAPGVDVRGEGGMVVAPPSKRRDGSYRWQSEADIAEAPDWLVVKVVDAGRRRTIERPPTAAASLGKIAEAMTIIPNDDLNWEEWNSTAMALFAATDGSSDGLDLLHKWSAKSAKYDRRKTEEKWAALTSTPPTSIGVGTLFFRASEAKPGWDRISYADFFAYKPDHKYIFAPTLQHWPAEAVNSTLPSKALLDDDGNPILDARGREKKVKPSTWLDWHQSVEQIVWAPGEPLIVKDKILKEGGWEKKMGTSCFNRYSAPTLAKGLALRAGPWLDHCDKILGEDGRRHVVAWLAHRVQKPEEKINHALVMGGSQGIGKDTLLEPVKRAIGHWNFTEASPQKLLGAFTARYLESVILRINEARDLGDVNRYSFYEHMKTYSAAPPDVLTANEKYLREFIVLNCVALIYTTNYKQDGIFLPAEDRRHYVLWSDLTARDFDETYWTEIWDWYDAGGDRHVAAYLSEHSLAAFNPKAAPPLTDAFWAIAGANSHQEDSELADVIEKMGSPSALTIVELAEAADFGDSFHEWLTSRKSSRSIPHRLEKNGYAAVRNPGSQDGIWRVRNKRTVIYAKKDLSSRAQLTAAEECKMRIEAARQH
jgi:hypothetical protein